MWKLVDKNGLFLIVARMRVRIVVRFGSKALVEFFFSTCAHHDTCILL